MGRPPISTERRVVTAVRLPESVHQRLQHAAADRDVSANLLMTRAVTDYLDRLPAVAEVITPKKSAAAGDPVRATRARRGGRR